MNRFEIRAASLGRIELNAIIGPKGPGAHLGRPA
jgi:hypothetical protein